MSIRIVLDTTHERADLAHQLYYSVIKLDDIKRLRSLFPDSEFCVYDSHFRIISKCYDNIISNYNSSYNNLVIKGSFYLISIYCLSDEWYYVYLGKDYFKCDQFSGMLKLLGDHYGDSLGGVSVLEHNGYNEYYYSIDVDGYNNYYDSELFINFTNEEIKRLMDKFEGYEYLVYGGGRDMNHDNIIIDSGRPGTLDNWRDIRYLNKFFRFVIKEDITYNIIFRKLKDEWYVVTFINAGFPIEVYKCDQWDGLEKLILDKL